RVDLLLDVRPFARREEPPFVAALRGHGDARDVLDLAGFVDDGLRPGLLVGGRDGVQVLLHRRDVVLDVHGDGRELDVRLLGDGAGGRDFDGDAWDAAQLVPGHDRAAREAPHAAVDHAHAESARLPIGVVRNATTAPAAAATAAAPAATTAASSA